MEHNSIGTIFFLNRPETKFIVVSHGDFIECMTGNNLRNAANCILEIDPMHPIVPKTSRS